MTDRAVELPEVERESPRPRLSPRPRASPRPQEDRIVDQPAERDIEAGADEPLLPEESDTAPPRPDTVGLPQADGLVTVEEPVASKVYQPVRTEPIEGLDPRTIKRKLDRQVNERVPEIHIVGRISHGLDLINDVTEGAFCRFKVTAGKAWQHLGGDLIGQTQIGYCTSDVREKLLFEHPIDLHFSCAGLQGWGGLRLAVQCYRFDYYGRRVLNGYGFAHIPHTPGLHKVEVHIWRPMGTMEQEIKAFLLGETPCLISQDPLYESAWKDRCRLVTTSGGSVHMEVFVMTRYWQDQGLQVS